MIFVFCSLMIDMTELHKEQKVDEVKPRLWQKALYSQTKHADLLLS